MDDGLALVRWDPARIEPLLNCERRMTFDRWWYSLSMLVTYVSVFVAWKFFPSRFSFVAIGMVAIAYLLYGLLRARAAGYFANRVDLALHCWVIIDLALETSLFEIFRLGWEHAVVREFHANNNFIGCTLAFTFLIGGYRWFATMKQSQTADGTAYGQAGV